MRKSNSVCFSQEKRTIHIIDDLEKPQAKRLDNWHISHLCRHCTDYSTGSPRLMQFHFMRDLWIYFTWHIRWQFMNIFSCGISQWSFEVSQPQNMYWFCSKMPVCRTCNLLRCFGMAGLKIGWMGETAGQIVSPTDIFEQIETSFVVGIPT